MTTNTLTMVADARVVSSKPDTNLGGESNLIVSAAPTTRIGLAAPNLPFPLGVTVLNARFQLHQKGAATGGSRTVSVQRNVKDWSEGDVTYTNRPLGTGAIVSVTQGDSSVDGRLWEFDVTTLMQLVADGADWYGLRITSNNPTSLFFYSKEAANDFVPVLIVEWSDAPDAPTQLAPADGRSISVARPTLQFDFSAQEDDGTLMGIQVQVSTSSTFASGVIDSGQIAPPEGVSQWTLNTDLTVGTTYYWHAKVQAASGLWSDWSATTSFKRTAKPTVTITGPAPGSTIYDPTPGFAWTVTGGTQTAFQLSLVATAKTDTVLWSSDKVPGAATSMALPASEQLLLVPGTSYTLVLQVWDSVAREQIPEETVYTQTSSAFTLSTSGSSAITDFNVTTSDTPFALLQWTYTAAAPDAFVVIEGGKIIATLDPADALVSGTMYQYEDRRAKPGQTRTWGVAEKIGSTTKNPVTDTDIVRPTGVWLYELAKGGAVVCIGGDPDPAEMMRATAAEKTALFEPPGAKNPVTITSARYGRRWNGVRGRVKTADVAAWETIESKRATTLGMTAGNIATKVWILNTVADVEVEFMDEFPVGVDIIERRS